MLKDQYRRIFVAGCMEGFHEAVQGHKVGDVCLMLEILGFGDDMFWWLGVSDDRRYPWTATKMLEANTLPYMRASDISVIEFIGGPDCHTMFTGDLLTLLQDRMLRRVLEKGIHPIREIEHILWSPQHAA